MGTAGGGDERAARLIVLLSALANRIAGLAREQRLLDAGPELLQMMGDARSELFRYEVRRTFEERDLAERDRIVDEARSRQLELGGEYDFMHEREGEDLPWQD